MVKVYLYVILTSLSVYALSGVNFNPLIIKNKKIESRVLVMLLALSLGYLSTNFIWDFINSMG